MRSSTIQRCTLVIALVGLVVLPAFGGDDAVGVDDRCQRIPNISDDSIEYLKGRMVARYHKLGLERSQDVLSFSASTLWSGTLDLEVRDSALFALNRNGLQVFNISDLTNPILMESIYLGYGSDYNLMFLDGNLLYLGRYDRLYIFDVSNPWYPEEISVTILSGRMMEILVKDNRAYVGMYKVSWEYDVHPALFILDVSDPTNPTIIGKYENSTQRKDCRRFDIVGDYIYAVNCWDSRLEIVSITDETRPVRVNYVDIYHPIDVLYYENCLYVVGDGKVTSFDVSDPVSPSQIDIYEITPARTLEIYDGRLVVGQPYGFRLCDFISPGVLDSAAAHESRAAGYQLTIVDTVVFLPEHGYGLSIVNISDLSDIHTIGFYSHDAYDIRGLDAEGNYAYVVNYANMAGGDDRLGLYAVDVTDKVNPELAYREHISGVGSERVYVYNSLLFTVGWGSTGIYSIVNPAQPVLLSIYPETSSQQSHGCAAEDTVAYLASCIGGFEILSIADPVNPYLLGALEPYVDIRCGLNVTLEDDLAYVLDMDIGFSAYLYLLTVDISDVTGPLVMDELQLYTGPLWNMWGHQMAKRGRYLYITTGAPGLMIIDIGGTGFPDVANTFLPEDELLKGLAIARNYLFVTGLHAIYVMNAANPTDLELVQYVPLPGNPYELDVEDDFLYATTASGLHIFHMQLPDVHCGDADASGGVDIDDVVFLVAYIFSGGLEPDPYESGDADCSGAVDIDDVVQLVEYVFSGGDQPCDTDGDGVPNC